MTATTHTPGPWHVDTYCGKQAVLDEHSGVVAERVPKQADAALIAAAPELLEALQAALDALDADATRAPMNPTSARAAQGWMRGKFGDQARAAIAKATQSQEN